MQKTAVLILLLSLITGVAYAGRDDQTKWWPLKKHWDSCATKEHDLDLEYMSRSEQYDYVVPHKNPIKRVAVLPPAPTDKFSLKSLGYFEKDVLFNAKEMELEFLMKPKKWQVFKSNRESYDTLKEKKLYDEYEAWVESFINYRIINKELFLKMASALEVDAFIFLVTGYDRPGSISTLIKSEAYYEDRLGLLNVYLFDAEEGKIIWEYGCELGDIEQYRMTRWRGLYRGIYKVMPAE